MAGRITITFAEEGQAPASFVIPESAATLLDQFIQETKTPDGTAQVYGGKAELFYVHNVETLLKPIMQRYQDQITSEEVKALKAQKQALEAQIAQAQMAAVIVPMAQPE